MGHLKMSYRACLAVHLAVQFRLSGWCRGAGLMRAGVYGAERGSPKPQHCRGSGILQLPDGSSSFSLFVNGFLLQRRKR